MSRAGAEGQAQRASLPGRRGTDAGPRDEARWTVWVVDGREDTRRTRAGRRIE